MKAKLKVLDRYIITQMLNPIIFGILLFTFIFLIDFLVEKMDEILIKQVNILFILKLLAYQLPMILIYTAPMGVLLGTMLAFGNLSSSSQITALEAAGISIKRILITVLCVGFSITLFLLFVEEVVIPTSKDKALNVTKQILFSKPAFQMKPNTFLADIPNVNIYAQKIAGSSLAENVMIFQKEKSIFPQVTLAKSINWEKSAVKINNGMIYRIDSNGKKELSGKFSLQRIPTQMFYNGIKFVDMSDSDFLAITAIMQNIKKEKKEKKDTTSSRIILQKKLSIPVSCLVLTFLGMFLSLVSSRSGKGVSFGISLVIIFIYIMTINLSIMVASSKALPVLITMWSPNALLLLLAFGVFFKKIRR